MQANLQNIELLEESFKREKDFLEIVNKKKVELSGDVSIGVAINDENDEKSIGLKLSLFFKIINDENEELIAKLKVRYLLIFEVIEKEYIQKVENGDMEDQELKDMINNLVAKGYFTIKEHIESTFKKAKIEVTIPNNLEL